jgi:hypothetical protein
MKGTHYTSTTLLKSVAAILRNKHGSLVTTDRNLVLVVRPVTGRDPKHLPGPSTVMSVFDES